MRLSLSVLIFLGCGGFLSWPSFARAELFDACSALLSSDPVASLAHLRWVISHTDDPTLKARLEQDFQAKFLEVTSGSVDQALAIKLRLRNWVHEIANSQKQLNENLIGDLNRAAQRVSLARPAVQLISELQTAIPANLLPRLDSKEFRKKPIVQVLDGGVMWGQDDQYMAVRPLSAPLSGESGVTHIYDLKTKQRLAFSPLAGIISETGHLWAYVQGGKTILTNFLNAATVATFNGEIDTANGPFLENSIFTRVGSQRVFWNHVMAGSIEVGSTYGFSAVDHRLVYIKDSKLHVVDTRTGLPQPRPFLGDVELPDSAGWTQGYFVFKSNGQNLILFLDDLSLFEVPGNLTVSKVIPGTRWIRQGRVAGSSGGMAHYIYTDMDSGRQLEITGMLLREWAGYVLIDRGSAGRMLLDLKTAKLTALDRAFDTVSSDGRWLLAKSTEDSTISWSFYDLLHRQHYEFQLWGSVNLIPNTDLWIFQNFKNNLIWVSGLENYDAVTAQLAPSYKGAPGFSPTGRYQMGIKDGFVTVFSRGPSVGAQ